MKELVEVIAKALVEHPEKVVVTERQDGKNVRVDLLVDPSDMGKVIGRQGRIAKAIRSVVRVAAANEDLTVDVNIDSLDSVSGEDGNHADDAAEPEQDTKTQE